METIQQQEKLPITEQQIKEFIGWYKKLSGKGKKVNIGPGETETFFRAYERNGKKYINAKNILMDTTRTYNPNENTISVFNNNANTLGITLAEDGELDQKNLENDLTWFHDCIPTLKERISGKIKNLFSDK